MKPIGLKVSQNQTQVAFATERENVTFVSWHPAQPGMMNWEQADKLRAWTAQEGRGDVLPFTPGKD